MKQKVLLTLLVILSLLAMFGMNASAKEVVTPTSQVPTRAQAKPKSKLTFRLQMLANSSTLRAANAVDQARALSVAARGPGSLLRDTQGRLLVYVRLSSLANSELQALKNAGAQIVNVANAYRTVTAWVDPANLNARGGRKFHLNAI